MAHADTHLHLPHHHGHGHGHRGPDLAARRRVLRTALYLNLAFLVVELVAGVLTNSLALLGDAAHMGTDVAALLVAITAERLSAARASPRHTFGYRKAPTLAAFGNALTMVLLAILLTIEAVERLESPQPILAGPVLWAGIAGLAVNLVSAWLLHREERRAHSHNLRGAMLHMAGDALGSVGVIISAVVVQATGWLPIDALVTLVIAALILAATWPLLRDSSRALLLVSPRSVDVDAMRSALAADEGVTCVEDLHAWELDADYLVVTATVHVSAVDLAELVAMRKRLRQRLSDGWKADHVTLELTVEAEHPALPDRPCVGGL